MGERKQHHIYGTFFFTKEKSFIARLAAGKLRVARVAVVIGRTIHLYNCSSEEFIKNERWLRHELVHIKQYQKHGIIRFFVLYLIESLKRGYRNNRFEVEARQGEADGFVKNKM